MTRITKVSWNSFKLPFAGTFRTGHGEMAGREGLLLFLESGDGLVGTGEAAPLPEFGGGHLADVLKRLPNLARRVTGLELTGLEEAVRALLDEGGPGANALACALDTAALDLDGQLQDRPLAAILSPQFRAAIPVNATVGAPDREKAVEAARQAALQGFSCVKLKVGVGPTKEAELARVRAVREAIGPGVKLRLDANGAWTVPQALEILGELAAWGIELVEQPVAPQDLAGLRTVRESTTLQIAADEPVTGEEAARRVIESGAAAALVIKPMVAGGLRAGRRIIELAQKAGLECFVTSSIDSGVGIAAALHLAATLPPPVIPCGLATAGLLAGTLVGNLPPVINGKMNLPPGPGLGVAVDRAELVHFAFNP